MEKLDIQIDESFFKGQPTEESFLTTAKIVENKIIASYLFIDEDHTLDKEVISLKNNQHNQEVIEKQKLATIIKLIQLNDTDTFRFIDNFSRQINDDVTLKKFYNMVSYICISGTISAGYCISNINNDPDLLLPATIASVLILLIGIKSKSNYYFYKDRFESATSELINLLDEKEKSYTRKRVECE